jgi:2,4-dienoyl-CoA reductase-like NADH-dependent reductase (Old Yellow Enzyme family)/thioredoxin reductase
MARYENLFSPFVHGQLKIKNRIVMAALNNNFSNPDGTANDRIVAFLKERAEGGAGLIVSEACPVSFKGRHRLKCICAHEDAFLPSLQRLARGVHDYGSALALQLHHAGRIASSEIIGGPPLAPSPIPRGPGYPVPKEITREEIQQTVADFGAAARRAKEAGFDAVEVHGAHGYLIHQFLSPTTNQRKDAYGGSPENRLRFSLEIVREVRKEVGKTYPVLFRLSAQEYIPGGYELEEVLDWVVELERAGVSVIDVSGGTNETLRSSLHAMPPMFFPRGYHVPLAAAIKKVVRLPVVAVGRLDSPGLMERVLKEGQADLVAVGRPFLSDPHWPAKAARGEEDRIRPCVYCNHCIWELFQQKDITCFQNAAVGREKECQIHPAKKVKKVFVIGGGPGGLEAARVAQKRGHRVTLFEKGPRLGGQMILAAVLPRKQNYFKSMDWLIGEIQREGVDVRLGSEGNLAVIDKEKPDAVIVATGASPAVRLPRADSSILTAWEVLAGKEVGKRALISGGGMVGIETAEFLSARSCQVTLITSREGPEQLATDMEGTTRALLLERLPTLKISFLFAAKVAEVGQGRALVSQGEKKQWLEAETIISAQGSRAEQDLLRTLEGKIPQIFSIGDCVEPRSAKEAIHEGFLAGLKV